MGTMGYNNGPQLYFCYFENTDHRYEYYFMTNGHNVKSKVTNRLSIPLYNYTMTFLSATFFCECEIENFCLRVSNKNCIQFSHFQMRYDKIGKSQ